jgi:hypothetical protein
VSEKQHGQCWIGVVLSSWLIAPRTWRIRWKGNCEKPVHVGSRRKMETLRIKMSASGERATKYFDAALATSKYNGSERGQWGGKRAELLGLQGDVGRKDFIALASNNGLEQAKR